MEIALTNPIAYKAVTGLNDGQIRDIGDINGDGFFNNADLQAILDLLKSGGGSTSVPEPSTFVLAVLAFGMALSCRRMAYSA